MIMRDWLWGPARVTFMVTFMVTFILDKRYLSGLAWVLGLARHPPLAVASWSGGCGRRPPFRFPLESWTLHVRWPVLYWFVWASLACGI